MSDLLYQTTEILKCEKPSFTTAQAIKTALDFIRYQSSSRFEPNYNMIKEILDTISLLSLKEKWQNPILVTEKEIGDYLEEIAMSNLNRSKNFV